LHNDDFYDEQRKHVRNQFDVLWFSPASNTVPVFTTAFSNQPSGATTTASDIKTPTVGGTWTIKVCVTNSGCNGNANNTFSSSKLEVVAQQDQTITFTSTAPVGAVFGGSYAVNCYRRRFG
jgi:hypothetical protein